MSPHTPMGGTPSVPPSSGENPVVSSSRAERTKYTPDERLLLLERDQDELERYTRRSLNSGASRFSAIEHETNSKFEKIEKDLKDILAKIERKPISVLQVSGLLLSALVLGGGIVFAAGQASTAIKGVDVTVEQVVKLRIDNARVSDRLEAVKTSIEENRAAIRALQVKP